MTAPHAAAALPWSQAGTDGAIIIDASGAIVIAQIHGDDPAATAALIIRAVNNHAALVTALSGILAILFPDLIARNTDDSPARVICVTAGMIEAWDYAARVLVEVELAPENEEVR